MSKRLMTLPVVALTLAMAMPAFAQSEPTAETVVATVNGVEITLGHVIAVRTTLPEQYNQLPNDVLFNGIIDQLVQQELLAQDEKAVMTKRVAMSMDNERRAGLASVVIEKVLADAVTDEAVQAAYDAQYASGPMGTEYNASHILVETEEEAIAIVEELKAGAVFADVAKEKSTGPSGPNGGELGWFGAGMMVEPFQAAVETLEVGQISEPVQTQFGWHVIILNETREQAAPGLDEVRAQLEQEVQQTAVKSYIDALTANGDVQRSPVEGIDAALINKVELLEE